MTVPGDVHVGGEGWLFLIGGSNEVLRYFTSADHFDEAKVGAWIRLLHGRLDKARALGCAYYHLAVPDKLTVYPEYFLDPLPLSHLAPATRLARAMEDEAALDPRGSAYVDLLPFFAIQKAKGIVLYWKTDTHWTFEGAFSAYQVLCHRLSAAFNAELLSAPAIEGPLVLDLGAKVSPPIWEEFSSRKLILRAERVFANDLVQYKERFGRENDGGLHVGSHVVYRNTAPGVDPRRLVLFGDSFAEYRPSLLTGMLAETFAEVHFVWSSRIDWGYVERVRPDVVLTELAERFMNQVPVDDLDIKEFSADRVRDAQRGPEPNG